MLLRMAHQHLVCGSRFILRQQQRQQIIFQKMNNSDLYCIDCLDSNTISQIDLINDVERQSMDPPKKAHLYQFGAGRWYQIPFSEMPTYFDRLYIDYFDAKVVDLLKELRPSLLTSSKIELKITHEIPPFNNRPRRQICVPATLTALGQLLPLIGCPEKILVANKKDLLIIRDHFPDTFYGSNQLDYRVEDKWDEQSLYLLWDWLCNCQQQPPTTDGGLVLEPRHLKLQVSRAWILKEMREKFKERFLNATKKATHQFSIDVSLPRNAYWFPYEDEEEENDDGKKTEESEAETGTEAEIVENDVTGERLCVQKSPRRASLCIHHDADKEKKKKLSSAYYLYKQQRCQIILRCPALTWQEEQRCRDAGRDRQQQQLIEANDNNNNRSSTTTWIFSSDRIRALENDNHRLQVELVEARLVNAALEQQQMGEAAAKREAAEAKLEEMKKLLLNEEATTTA